AKLSPFFSDLAQSSQTPDLKTSGVSQQCALPTDETMKPTGSFDHVDSRPEPEMVGVAEDDFRVEIGRLELFKANAFDRAGGTDRHEHRRFNRASPRRQHTRARLSILRFDFKTYCRSRHCLFILRLFVATSCASPRSAVASRRSQTLRAI